jgi:hypothetical protein
VAVVGVAVEDVVGGVVKEGEKMDGKRTYPCREVESEW